MKTRGNPGFSRKALKLTKPARGGKAFKLPAFMRGLSHAYQLTYPAKAVLFRQGDSATSVYYVVSGKIQVTATSKQGKEAITGYLCAGDFFGEGVLSGQKVQPAWATTLTPCELLKIPCRVMRKTIQDNHSYGQHFMDYLLLRARHAEALVVDHLFNSTEQRLARLLLLLANFNGVGKLEAIPKISQDVLAHRVGTTPERISAFMKKFSALGYVSINGEIVVHMGLINVIVQEQKSGILKAGLGG